VPEPPRREQKAIILAVSENPKALHRLAEALNRRYEADYQVLCQGSSSEATQFLEQVYESTDRIALVLAEQWMEPVTGEELLARVRTLDPSAKRGLLIEFGDWGHAETAEVILRAMARGHIDYYVLKPSRPADEYFHRTVSEFLYEWSRTDSSAPREIVVIGKQWLPRSHELRSLLWRNGVPHVFHASDSEIGARMLKEAGLEGTDKPVIRALDGRVLIDPTNAHVADAYGVSTSLEAGNDFDVAVIGAGPAGLAAALSSSSEGLRTLTVESESIGGQAGLSSLIRNYLGFSRGISGSELAQRAYQQAWVFGTQFLLMRDVEGLVTDEEGHKLILSDENEATARAVILAMGVSYRRLGIPSLEELTGAGVFYGASISEAQGIAGESVYIVGAGNSAGQAAVNLARYAARVTLLVRGTSLAVSMSDYLISAIEGAENIDILLNTEVIEGQGEGRLAGLTLRDRKTGETKSVEAAALFILIGARPRTEWLPDQIVRDEWGFVVTGPDLLQPPDRGAWKLERPPLPYETSVPGVFAVGDARSGSVKRVAAATGEGSVVVQHVHRYVTSIAATAIANPPS
jgi:thioredoxin reductase (NADPH)